MSTDPTDWTEEEEAALRGLSQTEPGRVLEERVVQGLHERGVLRSRSRLTRILRYAAAAVIGLVLAGGGFAAGRWSAEPAEPASSVVHEETPLANPIGEETGDPVEAQPSLDIYRVDVEDRERMIAYF